MTMAPTTMEVQLLALERGADNGEQIRAFEARTLDLEMVDELRHELDRAVGRLRATDMELTCVDDAGSGRLTLNALLAGDRYDAILVLYNGRTAHDACIWVTPGAR